MRERDERSKETLTLIKGVSKNLPYDIKLDAFKKAYRL